jgi:predicted esterase
VVPQTPAAYLRVRVQFMPNENAQIDLSMKAEIDLYFDLHLPENAGAETPLLIAVHGYGANKRYMMREAKLVASADFAIASLQGPHQHFRQTPDGHRIGFGWLSDHKPEEYVRLHHKFVLDVIEKLTKEERIDPTRVFIYGFSQACALNFRFAFTYPEVLRGIIGVCGGIPGDIDTNNAYKPFNAETLYLYGDDDEFYTQEKFLGFDKKLSSLLPNYRSKRYRAKHEITEEMRQDMKEFLNARAQL